MAATAHPLDRRDRTSSATAEDSTAATGLAVVSRAAAAGALLNPLRRAILHTLAAPGSATTVADSIGEPRQLVNYHLRVLERAGLVEEVGQRQRRGLTERLVRATAAHYLVSPDAIAHLGSTPEETGDRFSATYQVAVAARTIREVAALAALARQAGKRLTTLSLDAELRFASPAARAAFADELLGAVNSLVAKYHDADAPDGRTYRLFAGAHPAFRPPEAEPAGQHRNRPRTKTKPHSTPRRVR